MAESKTIILYLGRGGRAKRNRHMDMVEEVGWAGIVHNI